MKLVLQVLVYVVLLASARPVLAAECGQIPANGQAVLRQLADRYASELRASSDHDRRTWARRAAEQLAFSVSPAWGSKSSTPTNPQTKDGVARIVGGRLCVWDLVNGTTRELQFGHGEDITGQHFIPVTPTNHLVPVAPDPPTVPPVLPPGPSPADVSAIVARLAALEERLAQLDTIVQAAQNASNQAEAVVRASIEIRDLLREIQARPWPTFTSNRLPLVGTITLTPR